MIAIEETATVQDNGRIVVQRPELKPGSQVKVILLVEETSPPVTHPPERRLKGDWGGALADLGQQYTSVELQHKSLEWWRD